MRKNSPTRVRERQVGALQRRTADITTYNAALTGDPEAEAYKVAAAKKATAEAEVTNLNKKGVRL